MVVLFFIAANGVGPSTAGAGNLPCLEYGRSLGRPDPTIFVDNIGAVSWRYRRGVPSAIHSAAQAGRGPACGSGRAGAGVRHRRPLWLRETFSAPCFAFGGIRGNRLAQKPILLTYQIGGGNAGANKLKH